MHGNFIPTPVVKTGRAGRFNKIVGSARDGKLVVVIGTGVSMALTNGANPTLSWKGLIADGFEHCLRKGKITAKASRKLESTAQFLRRGEWPAGSGLYPQRGTLQISSDGAASDCSFS
jgi:hypothetical protein